jgi:hypothetical protein
MQTNKEAIPLVTKEHDTGPSLNFKLEDVKI